MKPTPRWRHLLILVCGALTLLGGWRCPAADSLATRKAIEEQDRAYDVAFNRGDAKALAALYADDAHIYPPNHPVVKGRAAVETYWKGMFAASGDKNASKPLEVQDFGDVAVETGTWAGTGADGTSRAHGKFIAVWKKVAGQWKLYRETWNADDPLAAEVAADPALKKLLTEYDVAWLKQDAAAFARLLAEDFVQVDPDGKQLSKQDVIASAKSGETKMEVGHSDQVKIRVYGETAVVNSRWTEKSVSKGKAVDSIMQNVVVLVRKEGQWQVVSDQVTLVASPKH